MCTRYFLDDKILGFIDIIESAYHSPLLDKFLERFGKSVVATGEVHPTDIAPVFASNKDGIRTVYPMRWGFQNPYHHSTLFNARTETAAQKPMFGDAWKSHRCIVPASYYFEWAHVKDPNGKTTTGDKYRIHPTVAAATWLCGLYRIEEAKRLHA